MKKIIVGLGVVTVIGGVVSFFMLLGANIPLAFFALANGLLGCVPYFALAGAMDDIESLRAEISFFHGKLRQLSDNQNNPPPPFPLQPPEQRKETARSTWTCSKCQSVNKSGGSACEDCGALYRHYFN